MVKKYSVKIIEGIHFWKNRDASTHYEWGVWKTEVENWLIDNIKNIYMIKILPNRINGQVVFEDETEAMAFKLRWL